jgi:hypothetical protein
MITGCRYPALHEKDNALMSACQFSITVPYLPPRSNLVGAQNHKQIAYHNGFNVHCRAIPASSLPFASAIQPC